MKSGSIIRLDELKKCVQSYEESVQKATLEEEVAESPLFVRYKSARRSRLVVIDSESPISDIIDIVHERVISLLEADNSLSENVELFVLGVIPDSQRIEYGSMFLKDGLSLTIIDRIQMESLDLFKQLFVKKENRFDYDSSLYEYLSMSNETSDVKNSLLSLFLPIMATLPRAIIVIACCRVMVKPPKVLLSLTDGG